MTSIIFSCAPIIIVRCFPATKILYERGMTAHQPMTFLYDSTWLTVSYIQNTRGSGTNYRKSLVELG